VLDTYRGIALMDNYSLLAGSIFALKKVPKCRTRGERKKETTANTWSTGASPSADELFPSYSALLPVFHVDTKFTTVLLMKLSRVFEDAVY
jgi:hypothetical protein